MRWQWLSLLCLVLSCSGQEVREDGETTPVVVDPACLPSARVYVMLTDSWGREVPGTVVVDGAAHCDAAGYAGCLRPADQPEMLVKLDSPGLPGAQVQVKYSGMLEQGALTLDVAEGSALCAAGLMQEEGGCPALLMACGLSHPWFADSGRAPSLNQVKVFLSGAELFGTLYKDISNVTTSMHAASWWWQSNFELVRPDNHPQMSVDERYKNTAMALMMNKAQAQKRVMVGQFASMTAQGLAYLNTDAALRERAYDQSDNFEVIIQPNPVDVPVQGDYVPVEHPIDYRARLVANNPQVAQAFAGTTTTEQQALLDTVDAASWHQKVWVLDGNIGYISGMNVKSSDWDTEQHAVFDARRMKFKSTLEERLAVQNKMALPDLGPRKDSGIRLAGPGARDIDEILGMRWDWGRQMGHMFSEYTEPFPFLYVVPEPPDGIQVQVVATMPEPFGERSILESLDKAFRNAQDLIYIEDQYFRVPLLLPALEESLANHPDLCIIVATKPVSNLDGAKKWTVVMDEALHLMAGDRYLLVHMKVSGQAHPDSGLGRVWQEMDIHTKLTVVDDIYFSVGSANKNNRGLLYEGELNATVLDQPFVSQLRQRILVNASGDDQFDWAGSPGCLALARLKEIAEANEALELAQQQGLRLDEEPSGFVQPLTIPPGYLMEIGPDAF